MDAFSEKVCLSTPTFHPEELKYITEALETNWKSTVGKNIDEVERRICDLVGCGYTVALSSGTSALHLAGLISGIDKDDTVFCSDLSFCATVNPVLYERATPVFIDSEYETWNMDPRALEKAFSLYPKTKLVICTNLYGTPAKLGEIRRICDMHGATLIEDAAESLGATDCGKQTGSFGQYNVISFNGNKIITGSTGGCLLTDDKAKADHAKKLSTQAKEPTPWYQHEEIGYNYRMSNIVAGIICGQLPHLYEHISQKKNIYYRYQKAFSDLPLSMNPHLSTSIPNYWMSCILIDKEAMCVQDRKDKSVSYQPENGKTCPTEIFERLGRMNIESRPIWKPLHMQPIYQDYPVVSVSDGFSVCEDVFERGLCLPSDNKMSVEAQDRVIEIVKSCFD